MSSPKKKYVFSVLLSMVASKDCCCRREDGGHCYKSDLRAVLLLQRRGMTSLVDSVGVALAHSSSHGADIMEPVSTILACVLSLFLAFVQSMSALVDTIGVALTHPAGKCPYI